MSLGTGIPPHRSYNEKEIGELIQRATDLHEAAAGSSEHNLTLQEIEHIAAELGLPSEFLQAAAIEMEDRRFSRRTTNLWGGPLSVEHTAVVGNAMSETDWEEVVLQLRRFFGTKGQTGELGRAREWGYYTGEGPTGINFQKTEVTVRPGEGQTTIQLRKHAPGLALLYPLVLFVTVFVSLAAMNAFENGLTFGLGLAGIVGGLAAVRAYIKSWGRKQKERLSRLAETFQRTFDPRPETSERETTRPTENELIEIPEVEETGNQTTRTAERTRV